MTNTNINIETSTLQLPLSFRWVLVLPCLLVIMSSCRSLATTSSSLDLNMYQTGKTLSPNERKFDLQYAYTPTLVASTINGALIDNHVQSLNSFVGTVAIETGILRGWDAGFSGHFSITGVQSIAFDTDAGIKGFTKIALIDSTSTFALALLLGGGLSWGSKSSTRDINRNILFFDPSVLPSIMPQTIIPNPVSKDSIVSINHNTELWSSINRVSIALPMSWSIDLNGNVQAYIPASRIDWVIQPALHFIGQNTSIQDTTTTQVYPQFSRQLTQRVDGSLRTLYRLYIVPSISLGCRLDFLTMKIHPEFTISMVNQSILIGFGISIPYILIKS